MSARLLAGCLAGFLAFGSSFFASARGAEFPAVLYVGYPMEGLEPVALVDPLTQKLSSPSREYRTAQDFFQKSLPLSSELELFQNGEVKNLFTSGPYQFSQERCTGSGVFQGNFKHSDKSLMPLLAFSSAFPGPRKYPGAYPSQRFDQIARQLTLETYQKRGVKAAQLKQLRIRKILPFALDNGASIQFAVSSVIGSGASACPSHSLLLVVEKVGRRYVRRLEKYRADQGKGACFAYDFLSSFATGPSVDKILIQGSSRTARWYEILQRQNLGAYKTLYTGGGRSCQRL